MKIAVLVVLFVVLLAMPVFAYDWIINPANGHVYTIVDCNSWSEGASKANEMGGYLATISSNEENAWVHDTLFQLLPGHWAAFFGIYQPNGNIDPNAAWQWVTREPLSYTNWSLGEPSGDGNYGLIFEDTGKWNDGMLDWYHAIAFVEVGPVPESSGLLVLCGGLTGILTIRRRFQF